jgi:serine/threonine protein kinase
MHAQVEHIQQERRILQSVSHPFIIDLQYAFHTESSLFLLLEFCQGCDVYETMQARPEGEQHFSEAEARFITAEIALALGHLHAADIAFRDLKPENVLFDMEGHVRLGACR